MPDEVAAEDWFQTVRRHALAVVDAYPGWFDFAADTNQSNERETSGVSKGVPQTTGEKADERDEGAAAFVR